ncbi:MAG TPA: hypothetical protein VIU61_02190 [Kofleriaceae bacterium]
MIARRFPVALVLLIALAACGASQREKTLRATYVSLNAVSDGVLAYSKQREKVIATTAPLATVDADLAAFRARVDAVVHKLGAAYHLLAAALVLDDEKVSIATITAVALSVQQAWAELQKGSP